METLVCFDGTVPAITEEVEGCFSRGGRGLFEEGEEVCAAVVEEAEVGACVGEGEEEGCCVKASIILCAGSAIVIVVVCATG